MRSQVDGMTVFNTSQVDSTKQKMFFGPPLGVQRYDKFKYPVFDRLTQTQLGFFWRPEEVSLQKDRADYQVLNEAQKHIFTSNLKYQILLDSVQGRGPGMAFMPYCSLPELEGAMNIWQTMEMIHSRSYTHIIKNVYKNGVLVINGSMHWMTVHPHKIHFMTSKENSTEQWLMSISWKALDSMSRLHVLSPLENLNSWKDLPKSSDSLRETNPNT
jgi:hypothetical protein